MNRFGFLIHPLSLEDVHRYAPKSKGKRPELVKKVLEWMKPHKVSDVRNLISPTGAQAEGYFILNPMLPEQFIESPPASSLERVINACLVAQELGSQIVGLGGYNSVIGNAGLDIAGALDIAVTSGNSYTVATALEGALYGAELVGINPDNAHAAVLGATGSIGSVCAKILAPKVKKITLIARSKVRLQRLAEEITQMNPATEVAIEMDIPQGLASAEIVITATSSGGAIVQADHLQPGAVVCDVAVPHDVCREVAELRPDVLVLEGGVVEVPSAVDFGFDFGFPSNLCLACMAETMILTLEGQFEDFSLGRRLEIEKVQEITRLAKKHGFKLGGLRSFDVPVTDDNIQRVREYRQKASLTS